MSDPKLGASESDVERSEATEPLGAQQAVMIFVKRPAPGRVKTRLAAGVGAEAACDFYRACCEHVVTNFVRCPELAHTPCSHPMLTPFATIIPTCYTRLPPICHSQFHACINRSPATIHAGGGDWIRLYIPDMDGAIVAAALPFPHCMPLVSLPAFHTPSMAWQAVVIGSDIPDVDGATVAAALSVLKRHQVRGGLEGHRVEHGQGAAAVTLCSPHQHAATIFHVCHFPSLSHPPAPSGHRVEHRQGVTAVALCSPHRRDACLSPTLFATPPALISSLFPVTIPHQGIEWSTDRVLPQSLSALHTNGVTDVAPLDSLPRLRDIDTVHDLTAWLAEKRAAAGGEGAFKADTTVLSGSGVREKTGNGENALRVADAGIVVTDAVCPAEEKVHVAA
ncbi:unnamed protein product [Closterium sp. Naga37s-1]|nr:unnamed protein product [Closterium sp. Naga37s-1]